MQPNEVVADAGDGEMRFSPWWLTEGLCEFQASHVGQRAARRSARGPTRAEWNGRDWFVSFGDRQGRSGEDGLAYGLVSAAGDAWYSRTLGNLPVGTRVNVHIPGVGYVGVGETLAEASRFDPAQVQVGGEWVDLAGQELHAPYRHVEDGQPETDDTAERVVPMRWSVANLASEAYWEIRMFAN